MAFPRDIGGRGQYAPNEPVVEEERHESDQDRPEAAVVPGTRHQVPKVPKNETARADVIALASEEPQGKSPADDDDERHAKKRPPPLQGDESPENEKRQGIHEQVAEVGVQKRAQRDAAQSRNGARQDAPLVELMTREGFRRFHGPEQDNGC